MIKYRKGCFGLFIVCSFRGTSWPHGLLPGLLAALWGLFLSQYEVLDLVISDQTVFIDNPYPFTLYAYLVGFGLVFRTNFGYQRYWGAFDACQRMAAKWLDGAFMAVTFDAPGNSSLPLLCASVGDHCQCPQAEAPDENAWKEANFRGVEHRAFYREMVHLFSLMHALALQHLQCDSDLANLDPEELTDDASEILKSVSSAVLSKGKQPPAGKAYRPLKLQVLGPLTPEELECLSFDSQEECLNTVARVTMVENWIMRRLIAREKYEPAGDSGKTSPPILSRLYQVISDGRLGFSQACMAAEVPFPFAYQNLIRLFLWVFAVAAPFIINSKVLNDVARFVVTFVAVSAYFALAEVGDNLEDPYLAYDPNELPLQQMQRNFNSKLVTAGYIPKPKK
eukprot:gnl/TRDRNA2_/TRDRNA2_49289_c0_seq1.p1 gnl/TRDRNA2_/TRDRNA2_49289_c0~~gnl/TRDRNA2_/TRDRNA2_49289_c0_seq1.p1  ORF type:complete len:395 (+),score=74.29 gnl/TRDRNA2_/TRDRNA2_49289_c0_seq1:79-1263(+)